MKWTTANIKHPDYNANHELYVGAETGSFKKLMPGYQENPYEQKNLLDIKKLEKSSFVNVLAFGNEDKSEVIIGRAHNTVELYSLNSQQIIRSVEFEAPSVVGVARFNEQLLAGFANGKVQSISLTDVESDNLSISMGDNMSRMRQCSTNRNILATGGKNSQNNLKVFDIAAGGKLLFKSKNLPHDQLQLEVPVWDSDLGFLDAPHMLATCSRFGYVRVYDTRKQRRPVQCHDTDATSFSTLTAHGNYIYTGTTMGGIKAFDIRRLKTFVHTYKGFTGSITDVSLDSTGKYLCSTSLDRYVRVHNADSTVLLYQCYVKSKATSILIRDAVEDPSAKTATANAEFAKNNKNKSKSNKNKKSNNEDTDDEEYEDMFENMQTICDEEKDDDDKDSDDDSDETENSSDEENLEKKKDVEKLAEESDEVSDSDKDQEKASSQTKTAVKRKQNVKMGKNKKKKN